MDGYHIKIMRNFILFLITISFIACKDDSFIPDITGAIEGQVLEDDTFEPISNAVVSTVPASETVLTDSLGYFVLENLPEGNFSLTAEKKGFTKVFEAVNVVAGEVISTTVFLKNDDSNNRPPNTPENVFPIEGANDIALNLMLEWSAADPDLDDSLKYDLYLFEDNSNDPIQLLENSEKTHFELNNLHFGSIYRWQVAVSDGFHDPVFSPIWTFETMPLPDHRYLWVRKEGSCTHIFSSDPSQSYLQLTQSGECWRPRLNPQRNKIAFLGFDQLGIHIFTMNREGLDYKKISSIPLSGTLPQNLSYCWAEGGSKLIYPNDNKLYKINQDGTGTELIAALPIGRRFAACDWSEITQKIVARTVGQALIEGEILLLDAGGNLEDTLLSSQTGQLGNPQFSPDGKNVLFTEDLSGFDSPDGRQLDARVFIININTKEKIDLSHEKTVGMNDLDARFSPNGGQIIFTYTSNDGISEQQIWIMDLDGEHREMLFENAKMIDWK